MPCEVVVDREHTIERTLEPSWRDRLRELSSRLDALLERGYNPADIDTGC
jgi:hypothetical protein